METKREIIELEKNYKLAFAKKEEAEKFEDQRAIWFLLRMLVHPKRTLKDPSIFLDSRLGLKILACLEKLKLHSIFVNVNEKQRVRAFLLEHAKYLEDRLRHTPTQEELEEIVPLLSKDTEEARLFSTSCGSSYVVPNREILLKHYTLELTAVQEAKKIVKEANEIKNN